LLIFQQLASCLINAQPLPAHHPATDDNKMGSDQSHSCQVVVWVRSFIEPGLFNNNVNKMIIVHYPKPPPPKEAQKNAKWPFSV